ncbi:hypothetical protein RN001_011401 [Aquatica leii]|uniref:Peptidase S1 domain-containing protein n=1 Tax=Aquatica leii TaxID=1421715 RepID=A0AAN7SQS0_9COLE|nr:hypothetical protein RN001_011401 [Aquatica leii]
MAFVKIVNLFVFLFALCSSSFAAVDKRIVNGVPAATGQYNFMVSLRSSHHHFCGGTVFNAYWIITAANCIDAYPVQEVVVGSVTLSSGGVTYAVASTLKNPSYNPITMIYDAGLVKTATNINLNNGVGIVTLSTIVPVVTTPVDVVGWGYTTYPATGVSNQLKTVSTYIISQTVCQASYTGFTLQSTQFCTLKSTVGTCSGDGGGPVLLGTTQFGIISMAVLCAQGYPDIHTKIASVNAWIITNAVSI